MREVDFPRGDTFRNTPEEKPEKSPECEQTADPNSAQQPEDRSPARRQREPIYVSGKMPSDSLKKSCSGKKPARRVSVQLQQRHQAEIQAQQRQHEAEQREFNTREQPAVSRRR